MVYVDANNNFIKEVINLIFIRKKPHPDSIKRFTETDIIKMLDLLIDNIIAMFIAMFDARVFQPTVGRLLDDVFLYSYTDDFNFSISDFPFICIHIPAEPGYGYISLS